MGILKGVIKKSLFIILPLAAASMLFDEKKLSLGILLGGLFGILNLRGLARSVERFLGTQNAPAKIIFLNIIRLFALFAAIFILIYFKIVNAVGLILGFTVVFVLILIEGMRTGERGQ
ncbi:MAG: ATP synthase subunit I [Nitrospirae bacterium]|nr:ATP synthase subunit I [Nitrospirota bacterium]